MPLRDEVSPKKYKQLVEKENKRYDKYMAGKRDPKTGVYYNHIHYSDPRLPKYKFSKNSLSETIGYIKCSECGEDLSVGENSMGKCCLYCGEYNEFSVEFKEKLRKDR